MFLWLCLKLLKEKYPWIYIHKSYIRIQKCYRCGTEYLNEKQQICETYFPLETNLFFLNRITHSQLCAGQFILFLQGDFISSVSEQFQSLCGCFLESFAASYEMEYNISDLSIMEMNFLKNVEGLWNNISSHLWLVTFWSAAFLLCKKPKVLWSKPTRGKKSTSSPPTQTSEEITSIRKKHLWGNILQRI